MRRMRWLLLANLAGILYFFAFTLLSPTSRSENMFSDSRVLLLTLLGFFLCSAVVLLSLVAVYRLNGKGEDLHIGPGMQLWFYSLLTMLLLFLFFLASLGFFGLSRDTVYVFISLFYSVLFYLPRVAILALYGYTFAVNTAVLFLVPGAYVTSRAYLLFGVFIVAGLSLFLSLFLQAERQRGFDGLRSVLTQGRSGIGHMRERYGLTDREMEVAVLLLQGHSSSAIAEEIVVSEHTVKSHIRNIYGKTGVSGKLELLRLSKERTDGHP